MATLYGRIYKFTKENKVPFLHIDDRQILGNIVKEEFFTNFKLPVWKKEQKEGNKTFKVLNYHPDFSPRMDELIKDYYAKILH